MDVAGTVMSSESAATSCAPPMLSAEFIKVQDNPTCQFISANARGASKKFGVKSISLLAVKP